MAAEMDFQHALSAALGPAQRPADAGFAARIDRLLRIEQRHAEQRRAMIARLGVEALGLAGIGAALWAVARSPAVVAAASNAPHLVLAALIGIFGSWLALGGAMRVPMDPLAGWAKLNAR